MSQKTLTIKKWVAISGSWAVTTKEVERDVRRYVRSILKNRGGIVTGGALNVDFFATDETIKFDPKCEHIKIFLPTTLKIYSAHYRKRAEEGLFTSKKAGDLIAQLEYVKKANSKAVVENKINKIVDKTTYFERNTEVVKAANELYIFHVNESTGGGTLDTAEKAKALGIPVKKFDYELNSQGS